jgi:hypothetical protein
MSQKGLLKYAAKSTKEQAANDSDDVSDDDGDYSKFGSKKVNKADKEAR